MFKAPLSNGFGDSAEQMPTSRVKGLLVMSITEDQHINSSGSFTGNKNNGLQMSRKRASCFPQGKKKGPNRGLKIHSDSQTCHSILKPLR